MFKIRIQDVNSDFAGDILETLCTDNWAKYPKNKYILITKLEDWYTSAHELAFPALGSEEDKKSFEEREFTTRK